MKISMEWLGEFLPGALDAQTCADLLTNAGFPVENIEKVGQDTVLDVEVTSNRGDCLCHIGVARELSALLDRPLKETARKSEEKEQQTEGKAAASIRIDAPDLCPHYTARILKGVSVRPSPDWMVRRLEAVGLRAINNIVDVTNYVLFEMGQPLHAFDFSKLQGAAIVVRRAKEGEKLTSIDGHERTLTPQMLVIADAGRPVALAGVMGGLESEVGENTHDILLESARFDSLSVRKTARALAMGSDSSYRFERGIDPTLPTRASQRAVQLILQTAGGEMSGGIIEAGSDGYTPKTLTLRLDKLRQVLGIDLPEKEVMGALARLQLTPVADRGAIRVTVPSWRLDLNLEIDLVEEVARIVGYDRIPVRDEISIRLTPPRPQQRTIETIRSALVAGGYYEAVTFSFVADVLADDFAPPHADALARADERVRTADARLRPSLLPGLLEAIRRNENAGTLGAKLFEIGGTFWHDSAGNVDERRRLALAGDADLRTLRGAVEHLLGSLDESRAVRIVPEHHKGFEKGAGGRIQWGGHDIGVLGIIDRSVAEKLSLHQPVAAAEIELPQLLSGARAIPQLRLLARFPSVRRDLSLIVAEKTRYEEIETLIHGVNPANLEDLAYIETYRGKPLENGTKSVTLSLIFRSPDETLTSEKVESAVSRVIQAAQEKLGATLRT
jgi:phenylalanyl-tRNA synthetase beta chain